MMGSRNVTTATIFSTRNYMYDNYTFAYATEAGFNGDERMRT